MQVAATARRAATGARESCLALLETHSRLTREGVLAAMRFGAEVLCADVAYRLIKSVA